MPVAALDFETTTQARLPYLLDRDRVRIVEKTTQVRRSLRQALYNVRFAPQTSSGPFSPGELTTTPKAFEFIAVEPPRVELNSWISLASEPVVPALVGSRLKTDQEMQSASQWGGSDEAYIDCDVRIAEPPARPSRTLTVRFLQAGPRVPRIRTNPLD